MPKYKIGDVVRIEGGKIREIIGYERIQGDEWKYIFKGLFHPCVYESKIIKTLN